MAMAIQNIAEQVLAGLRYLSGQCDGAASQDGHGFSRNDAYNGKRMAAQEQLSPSDVLYGAKMLQKYHNQITAPSLQEAKRYFAINGPARHDAVEDETYEDFEDRDMEDPYKEEPVPDLPEQKKPDITLSGEQKALLTIMEETRQHRFITGRAGTGKSVLLRHFRENTKKRIIVAAPTGIAALNVRGQTIHSLFRLAPQLHRKGGLAPNSRVCSLLKRIDTLVIDEISMVRADLLDAVDERLREAHNNNLPFGGIQVIMFGDVYQLPPVVEEGLLQYFEHNYGGYFFFHAAVWGQTEFKIHELSQVFRQKDPAFKSILNVIRDGTATDEQINQLNARCGVPIPAEGTITLAPTNSLVTNINQRRLDQLAGKAFEYKAFITGEMKRSTFPTEEVIQLKVGAQVVLLQNDKDKRWVNGTVATVASLKKDEKSEGITVHVDGIDYELEKVTWEEIRYEYDPIERKVKEEVASSFTQYPIRLAWAMTIHKSQGQTYESIALDLTTATFAPGQLYVALSRATSMEGLYLKIPVKRAHMIVEPKVTTFMSRRETIKVEVIEEEIITAVAIAENILAPAVETPVQSTTLANFFEAAIQDAANRGFTVQAIVDAPAQPTTPEQADSVKTDATSLPSQRDVKRGRGAASDWVKVAYKFSPEVVTKLSKLAEANPDLNKSAFIDGLLAQWFEEHGL